MRERTGAKGALERASAGRGGAAGALERASAGLGRLRLEFGVVQASKFARFDQADCRHVIIVPRFSDLRIFLSHLAQGFTCQIAFCALCPVLEWQNLDGSAVAASTTEVPVYAQAQRASWTVDNCVPNAPARVWVLSSSMVDSWPQRWPTRSVASLVDIATDRRTKSVPSTSLSFHGRMRMESRGLRRLSITIFDHVLTAWDF